MITAVEESRPSDSSTAVITLRFLTISLRKLLACFFALSTCDVIGHEVGVHPLCVFCPLFYTGVSFADNNRSCQLLYPTFATKCGNGSALEWHSIL